MSESDDEQVGEGAPENDHLQNRLLDAVADYIRLYEARDPLASDVSEFVGRYPMDLRDGLLFHCNTHRKVALELGTEDLNSSLSGQPSEPPGPSPIRQLGEFAIIDELGRGGMGVVYLAEQVGLKRQVALKVLAPSFSFSKQHKQRFRKEAAAAASLQHPGIVPIHSFGEFEGTLFYAMEFVPGVDLGQFIRSAREAQSQGLPRKQLGVLPDAPYPVEIAELVAQVAEALHHAHERGIIHRDVKPSNIVHGADGIPRIFDFGLAKNAADNEMESTRSGDLTGTPFYMSPEQTLAQRAPVDRRTDVFSLGTILYELCTLKRPFQGKDLQQVIFQICFGEPVPIQRSNPDIPRDLAVICSKALEKDPRRRYENSEEFALDLRRFIQFRPVRAKPASLFYRGRKWMRRNRSVTWIGAAGLLAMFIIGALHFRKIRNEAITFADLVDAASHSESLGEFDKAEESLRRASLLRPENEAIQLRLESLLDRKEYHRREAEVRRLQSANLLATSSLELPTNPGLALSLALEGAQGIEEADPPSRSNVAAAVIAALGSNVAHTVFSNDALPANSDSVLALGKGLVWTSGNEGTFLWAIRSTNEESVQRRLRLPTQTTGTLQLALSYDMQHLAVAEEGLGISLWNTDDLQAPLRLLKTPTENLEQLGLDHDGSTLAVLRSTGTMELHSWKESSSPTVVLDPFPIHTLTCDPMGRVLLLCSTEGVVEVWDFAGQRIRSYPNLGAPHPVVPPTWTRDGNSFIRVEDNSSVCVYDLQDATTEPRLQFKTSSQTTALSISEDGTLLGLGYDDATARIWSMKDGRELRVISGHAGPVSALSIQSEPGLVATASGDDIVLLHEIETGRQLARLAQHHHVTGIQIVPDRSQVFCRYESRSPILWDLDSPRPALRFDAHQGPVRSLLFGMQGRVLFSSGNDGYVRVWQRSNARLMSAWRVPGLEAKRSWLGFDELGMHLCLSTENDLYRLPARNLVAGSDLPPNLESRDIGEILEPSSPLRHVSFRSHGGEALISIGGRLLGWGQDDGLATPMERVPSIGVCAARPLTEESFAVVLEESLSIFRANDSISVPLNFAAPRDLVVQPDLGVIAIGGFTGLEVFQFDGTRLFSAPRQGAEITAMAIGGETLVTGHSNGMVEVWNATIGKLAFSWRPHQQGITALAISKDGKTIATGSRDHSIRLWPADPVAAAQEFGVLPLAMGDRERLGLIQPMHAETCALVDQLYNEQVLTVDVLSKLDSLKLDADQLRLAISYAKERFNPSALILHQGAFDHIVAPSRTPEILQWALNQIRGASRLQPRNGTHRIAEGLALYRLGQYSLALKAVEVASTLEPGSLVTLASTVRALCNHALGRFEEAQGDLVRLEQLLPNAPNSSPLPEASTPESPDERILHWISLARTIIRDE